MARKPLTAITLRDELWNTHTAVKAGTVGVDVANALSRNAREILRSVAEQRRAQREAGLTLSSDLMSFVDPTGSARPRGADPK
jgi:hypothetical protein